jgi:Tol biopolymer transport system component
MSLAEGETLAALLAKGPLATTRVADIARQMAEALAAAHRVGIVHRDIKPANVVIGSDGRARVLDFGLAKLQGGSHVTRADTTLGTAQYMAPEQIRGESVDQRADIFSFGSVLYEMLAGRVPFRGEHREAVFYSILNETPARPSRPGDSAAGALADVAMRAIEKKPSDRYQSADEMLAGLRGVAPHPASRAASNQKSWWGALLAAVIAVIVAMQIGDRDQPSKPVVPAPPPIGAVKAGQLTFDPALEEWPAWSLDGSRFAYVAESNGYKSLFVRSSTDNDGEQVTQGAHDDIQPAWSPAGTSIAFARANLLSGRLSTSDMLGFYFEGGDIHVLDLNSRNTAKLVDNAFNPSYSPDGKQLAFDAAWAGPRRIWTTDARGRNPKQITTDASEAVSHVDPAWSPDGTRVVYRRFENTRADIEVLEVSTQMVVRLTGDGFNYMDPAWSPDGRYVYFSAKRGGGLNVWRVSLDGGRAGAIQQVTTGAGDDVQPSVSPDGTRLAFCVLGLNSDLWRIPLDPKTGVPTGLPQSLIATTREDSRGAWSPDGQTLAFNSDRLGDMNLWLHSLDDGRERALTHGPGGDYQANWSPDRRVITFFSSRSGNADIWAVDVEGGVPRNLTSDPALDINPSYSRDGAHIAFHTDRNGRAELWLMDADGSDPHRLADVVASGHFMPWFDGDRFIFASGEGTERVIYAARVDGTLEPMPKITSGAHMSFSPDFSRVLEVSGHKSLWIYTLDGAAPTKILEFDEPDIRIDYPVWSADGRWAVFDRVAPQGGDIWVLDGLK